MRILVLTPQLPYPPRQGTAMRNWGLLSNLARAHEIWLLSFDDNPQAPPAPELKAACRQIAVFATPARSTMRRLIRLLASGLPDMAWRLWSPEFNARFAEWTEANHFDIIQVEGIELARYALEARSRIAALGTRVVFDDHNCEYLLQQRAFETDARQPRRWHAAAYSLAQWRRLRVFERCAVMSASATLCVSPQDAAMLARLDSSIQPHVIFNGIDVAGYAANEVNRISDTERHTQNANLQSLIPNPQSPISKSQSPRSESSLQSIATLVFTGKMDFRPNVDAMMWFGREVFPLVKRAVPLARLLIVGQRPSPRLDALRADSGITITGAVDDVRPYIAQATVYIAPLRVGGGTRFKLLEAMAMRRPIVSTSLGCEGFDVTSGRELLIGDTSADFAEAVVRLLNDEALRSDMARRAHGFVSATYDWGVIVPKLEGIYRNLLN